MGGRAAGVHAHRPRRTREDAPLRWRRRARPAAEVAPCGLATRPRTRGRRESRRGRRHMAATAVGATGSAPRAGWRAGGVAGRPDRHRRRRPGLRRPGAALGAQRRRRGRSDRRPRALRRTGDGARGGTHGRRVVARRRLLGRPALPPLGSGAWRCSGCRCGGSRAHGRLALAAALACGLARHGRRARPCRPHAHRRRGAPRQQLRLARS